MPKSNTVFCFCFFIGVISLGLGSCIKLRIHHPDVTTWGFGTIFSGLLATCLLFHEPTKALTARSWPWHLASLPRVLCRWGACISRTHCTVCFSPFPSLRCAVGVGPVFSYSCFPALPRMKGLTCQVPTFPYTIALTINICLIMRAETTFFNVYFLRISHRIHVC